MSTDAPRTDDPYQPDRSKGRIVIAANSGWNIVNFRTGLIRALQSEGFEIFVVVPEDAGSEERMRELGVARIPVQMTRAGLNPLEDIRLIFSYFRLMRRLRPAAFLSFTIKPNIYGALAARAAGVASIVNITGLGTTFRARGFLKLLVSALYRFSLTKVATVFFQNSDDRDEFLRARLVRPAQVRLLPGSGIDLAQFPLTALPAPPLTFLLAARLLADKGVRLYVEAADRMRAQFPDVRFLLAGPIDTGNPGAISQVELDEWVASGSVTYLGNLNDVRPAIAHAHVVVLPSSYREGVPHVLLEAAAMGRAAITTDIPGCRTAVDHGVTGIVCAPRSADAVTDAMCQLARLSRAEIEVMGRAAREKMERQFDERIVHDSYKSALEDLSGLAEGSPAKRPAKAEASQSLRGSH